MGGSAGNSNAQLLSLIAQYGDKGAGGGGSGGAPAGPKMSMKQQMQASLDSWVKNSLNGGFQGIPGFFPSGGAGGMGGGGGGNKPKPPTTPPAQTVGIDWKFPQYTQQWAFTPPTPTPYMNPPPFNPDTYLKGKKKT